MSVPSTCSRFALARLALQIRYTVKQMKPFTKEESVFVLLTFRCCRRFDFALYGLSAVICCGQYIYFALNFSPASSGASKKLTLMAFYLPSWTVIIFQL